MNKSKTQDAYDKKLFYWVSTLRKEWFERSGGRLDFGRAAKLVNLLARDIAESINPDTRKFYVSNRKVKKFLHVPFDSFSLRPLRKIIHHLADDKILPIPSNATMKYVGTKRQYIALQKAVRKLCKKAKKAPILYEHWSWARTH